MTNNPKASLYAAMAKAFPEIEGASKDKANPHFRTKYADLGNVVDAIKPALAKHELWFRQVTHLADGGVCVETLICHSSGEEVSCGDLFVPASKNDAQGYGSALTYCRRYSLMAAFGVAPEDDDGNAAAQSAPPKQGKKPTMTDAAFAKITQLLQATNTNAGPMLEHFKVQDIRQLSRTQYDEAVSKLEADLARMAKEQSNKSLADELDDSVPF